MFFQNFVNNRILGIYSLEVPEVDTEEKFQELKKLAIQQFSSKNKYPVLETIQQMIDLTTIAGNFVGMLKSYLLMGQVSLFLKDFHSSIKSFIMVVT